jgi:hypothetical protein
MTQIRAAILVIGVSPFVRAHVSQIMIFKLFGPRDAAR